MSKLEDKDLRLFLKRRMLLETGRLTEYDLKWLLGVERRVMISEVKDVLLTRRLYTSFSADVNCFSVEVLEWFLVNDMYS